MSVAFAKEESKSDAVKETIGTYEYVGTLKANVGIDMFWKKNPDLSSRQQFFLFYSSNSVFVQVSILRPRKLYNNIYNNCVKFRLLSP